MRSFSIHIVNSDFESSNTMDAGNAESARSAALAILGSGRPLFEEVTEPLECDLLEHATFENGVSLNRYQIRGQRTES